MMIANVLAVTLILLILYTVFCTWLSRKIQPKRLELARRGEALLADPRLPASYRPRVEFLLNCAFSPWVTVWGVILLPVMAVNYALSRRYRANMRAEHHLSNPELRDEFAKVFALSNQSVFSANPFFAALLVAEMITLRLLVKIFHRSLQDADKLCEALFSEGRKLLRIRVI